MRKSLAQLLLAALCLAAAAGCRGGGTGANVGAAAGGGGPDDPERVVAEMDKFTDELLEKVSSAQDPSAGLEEAQKFLDERGGALRARVEAARGGARFRESAEARARMLDSEVTNRDRVAALRKLHIERWMRDPAFKSKLDRLAAGYDALWPRAG